MGVGLKFYRRQPPKGDTSRQKDYDGTTWGFLSLLWGLYSYYERERKGGRERGYKLLSGLLEEEEDQYIRVSMKIGTGARQSE